jgi:hypothetical protein
VSPAALASALLALLPIGSIAAIPVGVIGLRQTRQGTLRGRWLAITSIVVGALASLAYGGGAAYFAVNEAYALKARQAEAEERRQKRQEREEDLAAPPLRPTAPPITPPSANASADLDDVAPNDTRVTEVGDLTVVDLGVSEPSLKAALVREIGKAKVSGEDVLVMTVSTSCDPCKGVATSLRDEKLQTALRKIRLVRVNLEVFKEDVARMGLQVIPMPVYALLTADGNPRDAIDGGEWEEDVPENIAPVLGAFVQGEFKKRKKPYKPGGGVFL